jgi:4-amino-4-deoxy-L-arabinose transferase-like glycosyltransferase
MPEFSLNVDVHAPQVSLPALSKARALSLPLPLTVLRLSVVIVLAIFSQTFLTDLTNFQHKYAWWGALGYLGALVGFVWLLWKDNLLGPARPVEAVSSSTFPVRWWLLGIAALTGLYAFFAAGKNPAGYNEFRTSGVLAWLISVACWMAAIWEGPLDPEQWWGKLRQSLTREVFTFRLSRVMLMLLAVLALGAYFRFAQLDTIPPEMTSDHVEKLLDVGDLVTGQHKVFFERNTGREPLQFYFAALLIQLFNTGLTHLTLKLTGAIAGFLLIPFVYLIGKELEDEVFGLLAAALTAISFWATAISRVGLRFPLTPVFVAPAIFFLLRGLRRGTRNDFLWAGLFLGVGLYGYSTIRVLPIVIVAAVLWFAIWNRSRAHWAGWATNLALLFATTFVVFIPLFRYATEPGNHFWERSLSRLSTTENPITNSNMAREITEDWARTFGGAVIPERALQALIFVQNQWNAVRMFNWQGDQVWVNTIPRMPVLDFIAAALFILGLAFVLVRLLVRRDKLAGFLPVAILILMLPSTLSFAFPDENPSVVRIGGAIPFVYLIAAYPLWLLVKQVRAAFAPGVGAWAGLAVGAFVILTAAQVNQNLYFVQYPPQYKLSAQIASEIGAVIDAYAHSLGTYDTAYVRPYPFWVDTRAVGMYAGDFWRDYAIQKEQLAEPLADQRSKLFVLNLYDQETIAELRRLYPTGALSRYTSAVPDHDFLLYFVPNSADIDESTLPMP